MKDPTEEAIRHNNLIQEEAINFCSCGLPKSQCNKVHKEKVSKRGRFSGRSKSPNRFYDYQ